MEAIVAPLLRTFSGRRALSIANENRREKIFTPIRAGATGSQ